MLSRPASAIGFGLCIVLLHTDASGQDLVIPSQPSCSACTLEIRHLVAVGSLDGSGAIGRPASVARDSRGRIFVVSQETPYRIDVFNEHGRYVATWGRRGPGPGEFQSIGLVLTGPGDTLHVFDDRNMRHVVFDPSGSVVRESMMRGNPASGYIGERIIVSGHYPIPESPGFPLHELDAAGSVITSFGSVDAALRPEMFYLFQRNVAASRTGHVWAAHYVQYAIEEWATTNRMLRRIVRDAAWFKPQVAQRRMTRTTPPHPVLRATQEDRRGRLWTLVQVAEDDWHQGLGPPSGSPDGQYLPTRDIDRVYGTVVEVLDPATGRVVAARRTNELLLWFVDDGVVAGYREDDDGIPRVVLFRLTLIEPERR